MEIEFQPITIALVKVYDELAVIKVTKGEHDNFITFRVGDKHDVYKEEVIIKDNQND